MVASYEDNYGRLKMIGWNSQWNTTRWRALPSSVWRSVVKVVVASCPRVQLLGDYLVGSHHSFSKAFVVFLFCDFCGAFAFLVKEVVAEPFDAAQSKHKQTTRRCYHDEKQPSYIKIAIHHMMQFPYLCRNNNHTTWFNAPTCLGILREFAVSRVAVQAYMKTSRWPCKRSTFVCRN